MAFCTLLTQRTVMFVLFKKRFTHNFLWNFGIILHMAFCTLLQNRFTNSIVSYSKNYFVLRFFSDFSSAVTIRLFLREFVAPFLKKSRKIWHGLAQFRECMTHFAHYFLRYLNQPFCTSIFRGESFFTVMFVLFKKRFTHNFFMKLWNDFAHGVLHITSEPFFKLHCELLKEVFCVAFYFRNFLLRYSLLKKAFLPICTLHFK